MTKGQKLYLTGVILFGIVWLARQTKPMSAEEIIERLKRKEPLSKRESKRIANSIFDILGYEEALKMLSSKKAPESIKEEAKESLKKIQRLKKAKREFAEAFKEAWRD